MEEGLGMHMPEAPSKMELFFLKEKLKAEPIIIWLCVAERLVTE